MNEVILKDKNGNTRYWNYMGHAWNAAAKLNQKETDGLWVFEQDLTGWFLMFKKDGE